MCGDTLVVSDQPQVVHVHYLGLCNRLHCDTSRPNESRESERRRKEREGEGQNGAVAWIAVRSMSRGLSVLEEMMTPVPNLRSQDTFPTNSLMRS